MTQLPNAQEQPVIAVAIDKDKSSQSAFKWALDNIISKGQAIALVHVVKPGTALELDSNSNSFKELFVPFRCFSTRKEVKCLDVILENTDVAKAIVDYCSNTVIEKLVLGAASKGGFVRSFRGGADLSSNISKIAPDFCTVYIISKGKVASVRNASRPAPATRSSIQSQPSIRSEPVDQQRPYVQKGEPAFDPRIVDPRLLQKDDTIRSPFRGSRAPTARSYGGDIAESDISFVSSGRPSVDRMHPQRLSNVTDGYDYVDVTQSPQRPSMSGYSSGNVYSSLSFESTSSGSTEDIESEMKRLRLELKQTMDLYNKACRDALTAKQKAMELDRWKSEEARKLEEARLAEEVALGLAEKEKARCRAAMEAAEASKRIAELEAQKRKNAEMKALKEAQERERSLASFGRTDLRYRKYSIEEIEAATENFADDRKIGEGGYGPVYKCYLDHTPAAIKVLRPDCAQGKEQFQKEVEILSCIRHPNMVLLLGACPEYGCLVYEYMANGSLEDRLFCKGNTPPIPWQHRFRIAAEIGSGLLFLHQAKPEPLVHRDLKPANILVDRNYVSKISDVGLARLVPQSVAENVTQYLMTSAAGTFCYIDPEYQQTGMLGIKSDIYSLGIILLQIITGRPPMGLTHHVERAIEKGKFTEMLDPKVPDWPKEEAFAMANLALKCAELRRKDRPDLASVILPELDKFRRLADETTNYNGFYLPFVQSQVSTQDIMSGPSAGYESSTRYSGTSNSGKGL